MIQQTQIFSSFRQSFSYADDNLLLFQIIKIKFHNAIWTNIVPKNIFTLPKFGNFFSRITKAAHEIN
ncbi:hypothetical protein KJ688_03760, partial [bacterium]|nr:hypothetical protein [bacterium]